MSLAKRSVDRPVLTTMITLIVLVLGAVSLVKLQTDLLPPVELPNLSVSTEYEGANPDVVERLVTEVIEEIVALVPGVQEISSHSSKGVSEVSVRFGWGTDIDVAATELRSRLEDELSELPENVSRPQVRKFDIASFPILILGIASPLDPVEMTTLVEEQIRPRLARIPGVAQVDLWGEYEREVRVELDPARLRAFGVSLDEVHEAVREATLDLPTGSIESGDREIALHAPSELTSLEKLKDTVVAVRDGGAIRIHDVGRVVDTHRRLSRLARVNGQLGLRLGLRKEADANTVEVAEAALAEIDRINRDMPEVEILPIVNQGDFIQRSIDNVADSVLFGGALAVLVLLLFLRDARSTLIIALAIPVSLIATFALLYFAGFTLNLMTLGGLALGVGMMVDNSIVVLDNVHRRRLEHTETAAISAIEGAREVSAAIVASTLTTLVIFFPLLFIRGVSGLLFQELAYVIAFSLTCSLLVSLTVVPMLASRLLGPIGHSARGDARSTRIGWLDALRGRYADQLRSALTRPWRVVVFSVACLAASILIVPTLETELFTPSDEGTVEVIGEMAEGTRLALVDQQTRRLEALVLPRVPEAVASVVSVGSSGRRPGSVGTGSIRLSLTPSAERTRSNEAIAVALREEVTGAVPGMRIRVRAPRGQFLLQRVLGEEGQGLSVEVLGPDLSRLESLADRVEAIAAEVRGVTDVERSRQGAAPQIDLFTDREAAADLGLDAADVARAIEIAVAGRSAGDYRAGASAHRILIQLANAPHRTLSEILDLPVANRDGTLVRLADVTTHQEVAAPLVIDRRNQRRVVRLQPHISDRPVGSAAAELEERLRELPVPAGYEVRVAGTYEEQERASRELWFAFILSLCLVYMVLAAQYESLRDPWIVMLSVPMAATGVFVALAVTGTTLNVQSYIGCIMLGGIVVNNAVLLVDQASQLRREGLHLRDALLEAGRRRLRPILMTTSTTVLGLVPLALGIGEGAAAQAPLARAVLGGLLASTGFTLLLVPAAYMLLHRGEERGEARGAQGSEGFA